MKKLIPFVIVGILVLSGLVGAADNPKSTQTYSVQSEKISFSEPVIEEKDGYNTITLKEANNQLTETGNPVLPTYVKTFTFSSNAKIKDVTLKYSEIKEMTINNKIIPGPETVILSDPVVATASVPKENSEVYQSDVLYPDIWFDYTLKAGLNSNDQPSIFVTGIINPVRYSPANNKLYYLNDAEIIITYNDPGYTLTDPTYNMVIIAPSAFSSALQPLINEKNSYGVKTTLKTTEDIYKEYSGRDQPEQIKYFLQYAQKTWGITYVLLVGGLKSYYYAEDRDKDNDNAGTKDWWVPVRYTHIPGDDTHGCISDLYYGDLYRVNKTTHALEFENWDSNGNGVLAEWSGTKRDTLDLMPDIYYGRLPCVTTSEVTLVVNKIINYEKPSSKPWMQTMVGIAGKTFEIYQGQPDGEYLTNLSMSYMGNLINNEVRVYASNNHTGKPIPQKQDILQAFNNGAGYVNFEGHGNPMVWNTIWADGVYPKDWVGGIGVKAFKDMTNGDKLPVVIVGGCHNALFNITYLQTFFSGNYKLKNIPIIGKLLWEPGNWYWCYGTALQKCFSWWLLTIQNGGAIASTGCTGYGMGTEGKPVSLSAELEVNFFFQIGQNGSTTLGSAHSGSIRKYVSDEPIRQMEQAHCVTVYELFGDPSLKLGGY